MAILRYNVLYKYIIYLKYIYRRCYMADYQKMYAALFNAATDALEALDIGRAGDILRQAQQAAEEMYLEADA